MKKKVLSILVLLLIAAVPFSLFACNPSKVDSLTDIYYDRASYPEFTGVRQEIVLEEGWSVATSVNNSDVGYIKSLNAFVITNGNALSLWKCGEKEKLLPEDQGIKTLRVKGDLIAALTDKACVYRASDGFVALGRNHFNDKLYASSVKIDDAVKILDNGLIAVASAYDMNGKSGYTSIYRPTYTGSAGDRGVLICRVKNDGNLSNVNGFDSCYVSVTDVKISSKYYNRIYKIPSAPGETVANLDGTANGVYIQNDESGYYCEVTYIGGGKFLVHEDWTVDKEEDHTYFYDEEYVVVSRHIYNADDDSKTPYESDFYFLNLSNRYYGAEKNDVDVASFLKGNYMYSSYGISVENKIGYYDQFILDPDLNVVLSLSRNFGLNFKNQTLDSVSFYDLIMSFTDGYGFVPLFPSTMRLYDKDGKILFESGEYTVVSAGLNSGMIIAKIADEDDPDVYYYGAFDLSGKVVIPFKYSSLEPFRGYYTIGVRDDKEEGVVRAIIGKDGAEVAEMTDGSLPLEDMATANLSTGTTPIFKMGCYMFSKKETVKDDKGNDKEVTTFGVKNFNANSSKNIIMPATMEAGSIMYAPNTSPQDVFVFEKIIGSSDTNISYVIYRLI